MFSGGGKMAFALRADLLPLTSLFNSVVWDALVKLFAGKVGGVQYEAGLIGKLPMPPIPASIAHDLGNAARRAWSLKRSVDTRIETSHAFTLPAVLQVTGETLNARAAAWAERVRNVEAELAAIQAEIDERCFDLYGIDEADRRAIREGFGTVAVESTDEPDTEETDSDDETTAEAEADAASLVREFLSWSLGVACGRFDLRLATGERALPLEPEPFDPLPVCSPGMLTGEDGLPITLDAWRAGGRQPPDDSRRSPDVRGLTPAGSPGSNRAGPIDIPWNGLLVDNPGHPLDIEARVQQVLKIIWPDCCEAIEHEACEMLGVKTLREYFRKPALFFADHLKRYSKSRRQAPIYWPLATASGSYTLWVYYPVVYTQRQRRRPLHGMRFAPELEAGFICQTSMERDDVRRDC